MGDGVYVVAIAWQVYELSDSPTALSLVGGWTLPLGSSCSSRRVSDRFERRRHHDRRRRRSRRRSRAIGVLFLTGAIELWHL